jgi:hypothetical protein
VVEDHLMAALAVTPLTSTLAARVEGVDVAARLTAAQPQAIRKALLEQLVLVLPGQELTSDQQREFAGIFGTKSNGPAWLNWSDRSLLSRPSLSSTRTCSCGPSRSTRPNGSTSLRPIWWRAPSDQASARLPRSTAQSIGSAQSAASNPAQAELSRLVQGTNLFS